MDAKVLQRDGEIELTILLPCFNEAETIELCVENSLAFLQRSGVSGEVVVADNGSSDASQQLALAKGARVIAVSERGYGAALRQGILAARGRYVIMGDADDSYDLSNLQPFLTELRAGYDVVIGNRFKGGIAPGAMPVLHRYLGNPVLSMLGRLFFGTKVGDFHCGLRGVNRERLIALDLYTTGMEFASEMVIRAALRQYRVTEVPTTLRKDGRSRRSHLRTWRDGWRHLRFLLMFSPRWLFIYPGLCLMAGGVAVAAVLFPGPLHVAEGIGLDAHTFIVAAVMILIGVQSISFGLIAQRLAANYGYLTDAGRLSEALSTFTIEQGLAVAGLVGGAGAIGLAWSLWFWLSRDFGEIVNPLVLRVVVLSVTAIAIGLQLAFTSFLSGILDLPMARHQTHDNCEPPA